jgi:hypothetical protein
MWSCRKEGMIRVETLLTKQDEKVVLPFVLKVKPDLALLVVGIKTFLLQEI